MVLIISKWKYLFAAIFELCPCNLAGIQRGTIFNNQIKIVWVDSIRVKPHYLLWFTIFVCTLCIRCWGYTLCAKWRKRRRYRDGWIVMERGSSIIQNNALKLFSLKTASLSLSVCVMRYALRRWYVHLNSMQTSQQLTVDGRMDALPRATREPTSSPFTQLPVWRLSSLYRI